jgi:hypothetical protein
MSRWLDRALAETAMATPVPKLSKSPKSIPVGHFGDYDHFGTAPTIADWQGFYDERAAIREFDGGFPRAEAEAGAYAETVAVFGPPPAGWMPRPAS